MDEPRPDPQAAARSLSDILAGDRPAEALQALVDTLFTDAPAGIALFDPNLRCVRANDLFAHVVGQPVAALLGRPIAELFPALASTLGPPLQRALVSGLPLREQPVTLSTLGSGVMPRYCEVSGYPITDPHGERLGVALVVLDTTERRQREELTTFYIQASEVLGSSLDYDTTLSTLARLLVAHFADWCAVDLVEEDSAIRQVAVAARDPATEALLFELRTRFPLDPGAAHGVPWVLRTGQPEVIAEISDATLQAWTANGEQLALLRRVGLSSIVRVPLVVRGRALGVLTLGTGPSGRRFGPAALVNTQVLARRMALAVENARLYEQARAALRVRDEFLMAVSHDLRTPLTPIKAFAQLLLQHAQRAGTADALLLEGLTTINASAERLETLVEQLLDVSRIQSGRPLDLAREPTDLVALVRRALETQVRVTDQHPIEVVTLQAALVGAWDPWRIERVVANLVTNAVKYSPAGGPIRVQIAALDREAGGGWAELSVSDQGIGIPSVDLPRVLEPFHRGGNVGEIPGSGIGLAGAQQIVVQHGGTLTVESTEGLGTTVTVRLPIQAAGEVTAGNGAAAALRAR